MGVNNMATKIISDAEFKRDIDLCNTVLSKRGAHVIVSRGKPIIFVNNVRVAVCTNREEAQKILWAITEVAKVI